MSASDPLPSSEMPSADRDNKRISATAAFWEALAHVRKAAADKAVTVRETDKRSVQILRLSVLAALFFLCLPVFGFGKYAIYCLSAADFCFLFALSIYVVNRFGILRVMSPRHALVCFQLMVGTSLFAMALAINGVFLLMIFLAGQHLMNR